MLIVFPKITSWSFYILQNCHEIKCISGAVATQEVWNKTGDVKHANRIRHFQLYIMGLNSTETRYSKCYQEDTTALHLLSLEISRDDVGP